MLNTSETRVNNKCRDPDMVVQSNGSKVHNMHANIGEDCMQTIITCVTIWIICEKALSGYMEKC